MIKMFANISQQHSQQCDHQCYPYQSATCSVYFCRQKKEMAPLLLEHHNSMYAAYLIVHTSVVCMTVESANHGWQVVIRIDLEVRANWSLVPQEIQKKLHAQHVQLKLREVLEILLFLVRLRVC